MRMRIVSAATLAAATFLLIAFAGAALVLWGTARTQFYSERMNLAHRSYEQHLLLSTHTYQLFKQFGDSMLIGDQDRGAGERELATRIGNDITIIRSVINEEIALVGEEELEELELLDELEGQINQLIAEFETSLMDENVAPMWAELSDFLDNGIDRDFRSLMDAALAEEIEEVDEARADLAATVSLVRTITYGFIVLALLTSALVALGYIYGVRGRLVNLMDGVKRMRGGQLDQPPTVEGRDELGELGSLLRTTAGNLLAQKQELMDRNDDLETAVANRTEELQRLLDEAKASERVRRRLLADVSHELRTPLTIIQGESDVALRSAQTDEDYREALVRARNAATHTASLVDDLLTIARKEEGNLKFSTERSDLCSLMRDVVDLFPDPVTLELNVPRATVEIDKLRMRQALLALLNNAQQHGGDTIILRLEADEAYHISVIDNGAGLSNTDKEHVFERFFRGTNAAGGYDHGTGLGLPIVRAIAQAHGGTVQVSDATDGGTKFTISLPMPTQLKVVS